MQLARKSLIKWTLIVVLCGAHSFFWGFGSKANVWAMVAGMITMILAFAFVESHPRYQAKRAAAPRLARALDYGVKIRLWLVLYLVVSMGLMFLHSSLPVKAPPIIFSVVMAPWMGELYIGMGALTATNMLYGNSKGLEELDYEFMPTYLTTLMTGAAHTIILGLICVLVYGVIRLRSRRAAS